MQNELQGARFVMPVISQGYVDSRYCLDELVLMMRSPEKVLPVYIVPPDKDRLAELLLRCDAVLDMHAHSVDAFCCLKQLLACIYGS